MREVRGGGNRSFACRRRASGPDHLGSLSRVLFRYALYRKPQYSERSVQSRQNMTSNYHAIISYDLRPQKIYENYKNIFQFALLPFIVALLQFRPCILYGTYHSEGNLFIQEPNMGLKYLIPGRAGCQSLFFIFVSHTIIFESNSNFILYTLN